MKYTEYTSNINRNSSYSWLLMLEPSEQARSERCESDSNICSTPRKGRSPTRHTGSSDVGQVLKIKYNILTNYKKISKYKIN